MRPLQIIKRLNLAADRWLMTPERNAAGRMGLFRLLYSAFYLWFLSQYFAATISTFPGYRQRIFVVDLISHNLSSGFFELIECMLVAALVLLMIGYCVRLVTGAVLILGSILEGLHSTIDLEQASVFLVSFIPLFMLLNRGWGESYALDALLRRRAGEKPVEPTRSEGYLFLPARAVLILLSAMFFGAAMFKLFDGGNWLSHTKLMAHLALKMNIESAVIGVPLNPFGPFIANTPLVYNGLRVLTLCIESLFCLALVNHRLRGFFMSLALIFHAINALWFTVTFSAVLVVYLLFVDWQSWRRRLYPRRITLVDAVPSRVLIGITLGLAAVTGISWNLDYSLRSVVSLGGLLDWRTIWYPALPAALIGLGVSVIGLLSDTVTRFGPARPPTITSRTT